MIKLTTHSLPVALMLQLPLSSGGSGFLDLTGSILSISSFRLVGIERGVRYIGKEYATTDQDLPLQSIQSIACLVPFRV